jgi:L-fuconolactonase
LEMDSAGVDGTIAVQARQTVDETDWLLQLADQHSALRGVVGWLPIASPNFPALLEKYAGMPNLKGLRHVVQTEPAGFLDDAAFNRGIAALRGTRLVYDLLIFRQQLDACIRFVKRHPEQIFVLDHMAKPAIARGEIEAWSAGIQALALCSNVSCKISGMVTEADPVSWTPAQLSPYFESVLKAFGPNRLMIGTDWPVLTVGCGYREWWVTVEAWISPLSVAEKAAILGATAAGVYRLP